MDEFEKMQKHIEELAELYIKEHNIEDVEHYKAVQEFSEFTVKASDDEDNRSGIGIKGYLSTFKNVDRQNDVVSETAFDKTIKGLKKLPMLRDHYNMTDYQVGSWNKFKIDDVGLYVEGFISRTEKTEHMIRLIEDGHLNTLSMGGLFRYAPEKNKKGQFVIEEVILLEGSIVSIPANPKAQFTMKSLAMGKGENQIVGNDYATIVKALGDDPDVNGSKLSSYIKELIKEMEEEKNES